MTNATVRGWTGASVPVGLWIVHLTALAALSETTCDHPELRWVPHVLTVVLVLACLPFLALSAQLLTMTTPDDLEQPADLRALGWLGLAMGITSLVLILAEELVVWVVGPCL